MVAFGFLEILVLLLVGTGSGPTDLVSFINADDYFQSRAIEVKAGSLTELAAREPTDGKGAISQLLAIRWLGDLQPPKADPDLLALME